MSEKLTSLEQLRMAAEKSKELSAQVAAAAADAIEELSARAVTKEVLAGKQDKLTGVQGQIVGFDGEGNAVPQTLPSGGVTSFSGRTGAVTPKKGDYSVSDVTGAAPTASPVFTGSISMGREAGTTVGAGSVAVGNNTIASATGANAEGRTTTASADYSHAEGFRATASGDCSHAEGHATDASQNFSHAEGNLTTASGIGSHAEGGSTTASGNFSHAGGDHTYAEYFAETAIGRYNVQKSPSGAASLNDLFVVGKGTSHVERVNAFRVDHNGVYGTGAFNASGADYAELFEWQDGNPDGEDRAGLFVTLDGEHIRIAEPDDDYILGIVSATPSVVGDVYDDQWQGMEARDVFGRTIMEMRDFPAELGPDGEEIIPARRELAPKLNPDYDHTVKYQPRTQRPEWAAVGLLGKLVAVDDGSCQVNGWAAVGEGGKARSSTARTKYRVMSRLDDTHVKLMIM